MSIDLHDAALAVRVVELQRVNSLIEHRTITVSTGTKNLPARQLYESLGFIRTAEREIASGVTVTTYERSA